MSRGAQLTIATVAFVFAVSFAGLGLYAGNLFPVGPWPFYGLAAFCVAIAVACLSPASRAVTLRIIGLVVFLTYVAYFIDSLEELTVLRALRGFCLWGLPSGYLAIRGEYPSWGRASAAFGGSRRVGG
ncbi:MAG: hypothetical protein U0800_17840 [Isosphaeraceae bacterium]